LHAIIAHETTALCSNGQAIMFYSCDLFIIIIIIFRALIFKAEECRPVGRVLGCQNVV